MPEYMIRKNETFGFSYFVRVGREDQDALLVEELIVNDAYRLKDFVRNFGKLKPKVILDFGGHIGCFGWYIHQFYPSATIYAFEPNDVSAELYRKNMEVNGITNVHVFNIGVSYNAENNTVIMIDTSTAISLLVSEGQANRAVLGDYKDSWDLIGMFGNRFTGRHEKYSIASKKIECLTFEEILEKNNLAEVDILKMDCEGAEAHVLINCTPESISRVKCIMCEYHITGGMKRLVREVGSKLDGFCILDNNFNSLALTSEGPVGSFWAIRKDLI